MRSAKSDYETNVIQSFANRNSSKIYKYIRGITRQIQYHLLSTLSLPLLPLTVTEHLCSMPTSTQSLPTVRLHYHHLKTFHFLSMSKWFVTSIFLNLKPTTFWLHWTQPRQWALHDGIGPKLITKALALFQPLHHLFSLSLAQHYIPEEWRIHQITPIHKSGDRSLVNNYRPIALLCTVSKVLDKIIYNHTGAVKKL